MHWAWKAIAAGVCGAAAHTLLMLVKSWSGLLPSFQPYESLQNTFSNFIGTDIHPIVPWMLSFVSGATIVGFLFGRIYTLLPGKTAAIKGLIFGLLGWMVMGLLFFPIIGMGLFAIILHRYRTDWAGFRRYIGIEMLLHATCDGD